MELFNNIKKRKEQGKQKELLLKAKVTRFLISDISQDYVRGYNECYKHEYGYSRLSETDIKYEILESYKRLFSYSELQTLCLIIQRNSLDFKLNKGEITKEDYQKGLNEIGFINSDLSLRIQREFGALLKLTKESL